MKRRSFFRTVGLGIAALRVPGLQASGWEGNRYVRLGGPVNDEYKGPDTWVAALKKAGYRAASSPVVPGVDSQLIRAYENAARLNDIVIAEVGAWSNPISPNEAKAAEAVDRCIDCLQLADEIGARCCVNISGSKNPAYWAGPHRDNMSKAVFDQVVEVTRKIIDAVKPKRTFFALEAMPWAFPYSTGTYLQLLKAVDRESFGVHLDPVNMITSPRDFYDNKLLIKEMFIELGPLVKSCHAKDIILREDNFIPQFDEVRPGLGYLNYGVFLQELSKLNDVPLIMEHLSSKEEYALAADYIRSIGESIQIDV
jgi:sugar phosphate isomerase/epimerase